MNTSKKILNKIQKAYREHRWQDIIDLIGENQKDTELASLFAKAKSNIKNPPLDRVGIANALFYNEFEGRGICIPVTMSTTKFRTIKADYSLAVKNANEAMCNILGSKNYSQGPEITFIPKSDFQKQKDDLEFFLEGPSIGLTAAIILLSNHLGKEIPISAAFSAKIDSRGVLSPIGNIGKKVENVKRNHPYINKIFVAKGQQEVENNKNIVFCTSLDEVVKDLWGEIFYNSSILSMKGSIDVLFKQFENLRKLQDYPAIRSWAADLIKKLRNSKKPSERTYLAYALAEMGSQYTHDGKGDEARKYFEQSLQEIDKLGENIDSRIRIFDPFVKYGVWLTDQYLFAEAEDMFLRASKLADDYKYATYHKIGIWNSIGQLYTKQLKHDEAKEYFNKSFQVTKETGEYESISRLYCYFAENEMLSGYFEEAEYFLSLAEKKIKTRISPQYFFNTYWRLYFYYQANRMSDFISLFSAFQKSGWFQEPLRFKLLTGIIFGFAAILYHKNDKNDEHFKYAKIAKEYISDPKDLFTTLILVKLDAHLLSQQTEPHPIFFSLKEILDLLEQANVKNQYFKDILVSLKSMSGHNPNVWKIISRKLII